MNLIRWNNYPTYSNLFDQLFNNHVYRYQSAACNKPAANIQESDDKFEISLAIPGVAKEDLNISLEDNVLTVSSEKEVKNENSNFTRREYGYSTFSRSFTLPKTIELDKIKADYKNGILEITLPKMEESKIKKMIKIS